MKNIYLTTTLALLAISGILMTIGFRPVRQSPAGKINANGGALVAQAGKTNSGT